MSQILTVNQCIERLRVSLKSNVPCFMTGSPGLGKSSIIKKLAEELNYYLIDCRLTQMQQYDLLGFPKVVEMDYGNGIFQQVTKYFPMETFPLENTPLPVNPKTGKQYEGVLLFLDEFNSADKYVQAACYKLILDRQIGMDNLHSTTRILMAGNKLSDNAIVHKISTAIKSRVTHISLDLNVKEFLEYVEKGLTDVDHPWNSMVYGFLRFQPEYCLNFNPKIETETYACPRTWDYLSQELNNGLLDLDTSVLRSAVIGTVGEKAGVAFNAFLDIYKGLPSIDTIVRNPEKVPLPEQVGAKYALGTYFANNINPANASYLVKYASRIPEKDIMVVVFRIMLAKYPEIISNPVVTSVLTDLRAQISKVK